MIPSTNTTTGWNRDARTRPRELDTRVASADAAAEARGRLILRLAADRLRELQDDGVTFGYIAHLYDTDVAALEQLYRELVTPRLR